MAEIKDKHDELLLTDAEIHKLTEDTLDPTDDISRPWLLYRCQLIAKAQLDKADRYYEKYIAELLFNEEVV